MLLFVFTRTVQCFARLVLMYVAWGFVFQAETRAEFAERSVAKLEKTIDDLEGILLLLFAVSALTCCGSC